MKILSLLRIAVLALLGTAMFVNSDHSNPVSFQCAAPTHPDYLPLMAFYNSTNGDNWTNNTGWGVDCDVCLWEGITCDFGRVVRVILGDNNLVGSLPSELTQLDSLRVLNFFRNTLQGNIPEEIFNMERLEDFNLSFNSISGQLPNNLGSALNLKILRLAVNYLEGEIPLSIGSLLSIEEVNLSNNKLIGNLPLSLGNASTLEKLFLNNNKLSGAIPDVIGQLANLTDLNLSNNQLSGDLPNSLSVLSNLEYLNVSNNPMSIEFPAYMGLLSELSSLWMTNAGVSGVIPEGFSNLSKLRTVRLEKNNISGLAPQNFENLSSLRTLYLNENVINSPFPTNIGAATSLFDLRLNDNMFFGSIPASINNLTTIRYLYLYNNDLTGQIPRILGSMIGLQDFRINGNEISGEIPASIKELSELRTLALHQNNLTGDFPDFLSELTNISSLNLSFNYLENCLPISYELFCLKDQSKFSFFQNCTFENPTFTEFCTGAECNNTLNLSTPSVLVCEGEIFTINSPTSYPGYEWSVPGQNSSTLMAEASTSQYYYVTITNSRGCTKTDSIFIEVVPKVFGEEIRDICDGGSVVVNGETYTQVGNFTQTIPQNGACDSTVIVTINQGLGTSGSYTESICSGSTTIVNGDTFGVGQFTQVITNTVGCDSTISIEVTALPTHDETLDYAVCEGSTYNYNGQELVVGSHVFDFQSTEGCDSTVMVNVGLKASSSSTVFDEICQGESVSIAGTLFDEGGEFEVVLTNQNGCDSIISVTILEKPPAYVNLTEIICAEQQFSIGTETYNSSGFYQVILQNAQGCDSIVNLDLTVVSGEDQVIEYSICKGDSYAFAGKNYSESIIVSDSIILEGCKSWVTLELTVFDNAIYEYSKSICAGEVEYFFDQVLNESGTYSHTFSAAQNCDSTVIINLNVLILNENTVDTFLCAGASLFYGEETFSEAGNFVVESETDGGCLEVTYLNIAFYDAEKVFVQEFVCSGELVEFQGQSYSAGQYTGTFDDGNCEVEFELTVAELARISSDEVQTMCTGDVLNFMGETYLSGGQYYIGEELEGCEFLENLIVLEASNESTSIPQIFCQGKSFQLGGESIYQSGIYPINADAPCFDQFYDVLFVSGEELSLTKTILAGSEVIIDNEVFDAAGSYEIVIGEEVGCPTILILTIIVEQCGGVRNEKKSICEGESIQFFDQVINTPGSYQYLKKLDSGCDSVINFEIELSTIKDFQIEGAAFLCEGEEVVLSGPEGYDYLWSNGATASNIAIQQGGVYDLTITNINGCSLTKSMEVEEVKFPNTAIDIIAKDPSSCNTDNGRIVIATNDGQNYQYSIDGGLTFQNDSSFVDLANGAYNIVLSDDQLRCFKALSTSVKLESAGVPEIDEIEIRGVNGCLGNLGSITVIPFDLNQTYEYSIDGGLTWSPDNIFSSLEVGFYDVQMKLPNNDCINNLSALIEIEEEEALEAEISVESELTCMSSFDGILELQIVSGKPPYSILWSNGDTTLQSRNLPAGIYSVNIEDSNQCSQFLELELTGFETESLLLAFEDVIKCEDEWVLIEVDSNYTYEIFKDGQLYFEGSQIEIKQAGQYEVVVDLGETCKSSSVFSVENLDVDGLGIDFLLSTEGVKDVEVYGINVSQLSDASFEWEVSGNAVQIDSIDQYTQGFTFRDTGVYKVSLKSTVNNCQVSLEKAIIIYPDSTFLLDPTDSDQPSSLAGFGSWNVYPSPNDGSFEVEIEMLSKKLPATIAIYDVYGSRILKKDLQGSKEYLEAFTLYNVGTGIYNISLIVRDRIFYKNILIIK